ncbi:hypothetical protein MGYG_08936 [Nannizzia gypsea CBS 118893]|uniref:Uncharacterized protein n=1 Tax=Arthroderma gypseum (strain ATCC MYA-4604 / CBS 118893) TaxID=535722 RepID=E5R1G0_ARTGP|nr:hypothetical protein MGYG_08936 [Nannizzia gypsea CBS 118893]EFQ98496.1 hypothetical protein MGYG_08936 [Nannizzia gypsea CBS 118893]
MTLLAVEVGKRKKGETGKRRTKEDEEAEKEKKEKLLTLFDTGYGKAINGGPGKKVTSTELVKLGKSSVREAEDVRKRKEKKTIQSQPYQGKELASDILDKFGPKKGEAEERAERVG